MTFIRLMTYYYEERDASDFETPKQWLAVREGSGGPFDETLCLAWKRDDAARIAESLDARDELTDANEDLSDENQTLREESARLRIAISTVANALGSLSESTRSLRLVRGALDTLAAALKGEGE